jgi:hypothetical protein
MPYQTFIFGFKRVALATLAGLTSGDVALTADPLPRVVVSVAIQGNEYERSLGGNRDIVAGALVDSLRSSLSRRFGFVNWSGPARDTLQVSWRQRQSSPRDGYLHVRVLGASKIRDTMAIFLEGIGAVLDRPALDWSAPMLAQRWSQEADSLFSLKHEQLVKSIFANLPISARVRFDGAARRGYISLRPTQIRAASAEDEEFRVRLEVRDAESRGSGWVALGGCTDGIREAALVCEMGDFTYRGRTAPAKDRQDELRTLQLKPLSVHLVRHAPASVSTGVGGIVEVP